MTLYVPDGDSQFDEAVRAFRVAPRNLHAYATEMLEELSSVVAMKLSCPAYEGDRHLAEFGCACEVIVIHRLIHFNQKEG